MLYSIYSNVMQVCRFSSYSEEEFQKNQREAHFRLAIRNDRAEIADFISQLNIPFENGDLPLHYAVKNNASVDRLLSAGADPYQLDRWGKTAFDYATFIPSSPAMEELLRALVGNTSYRSTMNTMTSMLGYLLSDKSPLFLETDKGSIAHLEQAISKAIEQASICQEPIIHLLQKTPKELQENSEHLEKLLSFKVISPTKELSLASLAATFSSLETFQFLIEKGLLSNVKSENSPLLPIYFCASNNRPEILRYLLENELHSAFELEESLCLFLSGLRKRNAFDFRTLTHDIGSNYEGVALVETLLKTLFSLPAVLMSSYPDFCFDGSNCSELASQAAGYLAVMFLNTLFSTFPVLYIYLNKLDPNKLDISSSMRKILTEGKLFNSCLYALLFAQILPPSAGLLFSIKKIYDTAGSTFRNMRDSLQGYDPLSDTQKRSFFVYSLQGVAEIFAHATSLLVFSRAVFSEKIQTQTINPWTKNLFTASCAVYSFFKGARAIFGYEDMQMRNAHYNSSSKGLLSKTVKWIFGETPLRKRVQLIGESLMFSVPIYLLLQTEFKELIRNQTDSLYAYFQRNEDKKILNCLENQQMFAYFSPYQKCKKMINLTSCVNPDSEEISLERLYEKIEELAPFFLSQKQKNAYQQSEYKLYRESIREWLIYLKQQVGKQKQNCDDLLIREILKCADSYPFEPQNKCFAFEKFKRCFKDSYSKGINSAKDIHKKIRSLYLYAHPDKQADRSLDLSNLNSWVEYLRSGKVSC